MSFLDFTYVDENASHALFRSTSADQAAHIISSRTTLLTPSLSPEQHQVELEMYVNQTRFCLEEKLNIAQLSTYLAIIKDTINFGIKNRATEKPAYRFFEAAVLAHAADRPPFSINIFRFEEVRSIFAFADRCFFRLYPLYMRTFLPDIHLEISACARGEEPLPPAEPSEEEKIEKELVYDFRGPVKDESRLIETLFRKYANGVYSFCVLPYVLPVNYRRS
jgi:hypothetical protein